MTRSFFTRFYRLQPLAAVFLALTSGGAMSGKAQSETTLPLTYEGRTVDSAPYFYAFPYRLERVSIEHRKIYFSRHVEG